eukprot:scaffold862_cov76-Skeletonema_dohrnii-CCMP3373.AAC.3
MELLGQQRRDQKPIHKPTKQPSRNTWLCTWGNGIVAMTSLGQNDTNMVASIGGSLFYCCCWTEASHKHSMAATYSRCLLQSIELHSLIQIPNTNLAISCDSLLQLQSLAARKRRRHRDRDGGASNIYFRHPDPLQDQVKREMDCNKGSATIRLTALEISPYFTPFQPDRAGRQSSPLRLFQPPTYPQPRVNEPSTAEEWQGGRTFGFVNSLTKSWPIQIHGNRNAYKTRWNRCIHAGRCGKTGVATTFINKSCEETTLVDLKHLLKEAHQRIPPVLMIMDDPLDNVGADGGQKGCSFCFCGGLGHTIVDCPKIGKDARRVAGGRRDALATGDGYGGEI